MSNFPENWRIPLEQPLNEFFDKILLQYGDAFETFSDTILFALVGFDQFLRELPWWLVIALIAGMTWHASRRISLTLGLAISMFLIGLLGLWDLAMQTLALMLIATSISIVIGVPIGILMAWSNRLRSMLLPVLDAMQTLPSFVYLIPFVMLFGLGKVPAIFATVIYAVPPLIRLTDLGIRQVDSEVLEAAKAFGANARQRLFGVQLPLAMPNILAGINQTMMMALAMVVIASMIGVRGLGQEVLSGIQRQDVGKGFAAGIAIVILAIVFDRISQAYGKKLMQHGKTQ